MHEEELYDLKWFDYRPLPPDTATMAFTHQHIEFSGRYLEDLGEEGGKQISRGILKSLDPQNVRGWKFFPTMEKLRQWADKNGMRYDHFWELAMIAYNDLGFGTVRLTEKFYSRKAGKVLTQVKPYRCLILNLFTTARMLARILESHRELKETTIIKSNDPYFQPENYAAEPLQVDYFRYLCMELMTRYPGSYKDRLDNLGFNARIITDVVVPFQEASRHEQRM